MAWQRRRVVCSTMRTLQTSRPHLPGVHCKSPSPVTNVVSARHLPFLLCPAINFMDHAEPHIRFDYCHAGGRTERLVNPVAWEKGLIFAQCGSCESWHKLRDECSMVEEIRYIDEPT